VKLLARHMSLKGLGALVALGLFWAAHAACAQTPEVPHLDTGQTYVEQVLHPATLAIDDPMAVLAFVLGSLPDRVKVYPTGNYYYFRFIHNGLQYAGNLRLDAINREDGKVNFDYYVDTTEWKDDLPITHLLLGAAQGVTVEKVDNLAYRIAYKGKSVVFALNDLSQVKPPPSAIAPDERFLGTIFDESAIRFFLIYNRKIKAFLYILDETEKVPEEFFRAKATDRILIGERTGFAFYRDLKLDRKILIGAFAANSFVNNYFDGPFDQLPENVLEGDTLRDFILEIEPDLKGKIDRLGWFNNGDGQFLVHPYMLYRKLDELSVFHACATSKTVPAAEYYNCFVIDDNQVEGSAKPVALIKKHGKFR
jgi:hypothetical protein